MADELENKIKDALKDVKPWQRIPTTVSGVYLVKTPADVTKESIMVEINPLNERGAPMKRRGLFLRDTLEFGGFKGIFENESVLDLLAAIEELDGKEKKSEIKAIEI